MAFAILTFPQATGAQLSQAAASAKEPAQAPTAETPPDPLGRTNPRGTVIGFLSAASAQKYDTAAQYLNTRLHGQDAVTLVQQLSFVLDHKLPAKLNDVSRNPLGSLTNPADSRHELIGTVVTEQGRVDIDLERIDRPNGVPIWLFSRDTLADIPDVYREINAKPVENMVPDFLLKKYFGVTLVVWIYFLAFLPLVYVVLSVINRLAGGPLAYVIRRWGQGLELHNPNILPHPLRILILSITMYLTLRNFNMSLLARQAGSTIAAFLLILAFVWAMFLISARCETYLKRRMESQGRLSSTAVLRPARGVVDFLAVVVGFMLMLSKLGINPSAALAGLGVGGIAIALAAQKTLENVIGGVSLILDGAVRVGDSFKMGDVTGTIEVIGLRSTRVRTLDRTLVTIPNGQMATMTLENFSARDQFWLRQVIGVDRQTQAPALNSLLTGVRALLDHDPRVLPATMRARFLRFAESTLDLEVVAYVAARDWSHFLEIQEDILVRIRELIRSAGVEFGYPARAIYLKNEIAMDSAPLETLPHGAIASEGSAHVWRSR